MGLRKINSVLEGTGHDTIALFYFFNVVQTRYKMFFCNPTPLNKSYSIGCLGLTSTAAGGLPSEMGKISTQSWSFPCLKKKRVVTIT